MSSFAKVPAEYAKLTGKRGNSGSAKVGSWHRSAKQKRKYPHGLSQTIHLCDYERKEVIRKSPIVEAHEEYAQDYNYKLGERRRYPVALTSDNPEELAIMTININNLSKFTWDPSQQALGTTLYKHGTVQQALWDMSQDKDYANLYKFNEDHQKQPPYYNIGMGKDGMYPDALEWAPGCAQGVIGSNNQSSFRPSLHKQDWEPNQYKMPEYYNVTTPDGKQLVKKAPAQNDGLLYFSNSTCWNLPNYAPEQFSLTSGSFGHTQSSLQGNWQTDYRDCSGSVLRATLPGCQSTEVAHGVVKYKYDKDTWKGSRATGFNILPPAFRFYTTPNNEGHRHPHPLNQTSVHDFTEFGTSEHSAPAGSASHFGKQDFALPLPQYQNQKEAPWRQYRPFAPNVTLAPSTCFVTSTKYPHPMASLDPATVTGGSPDGALIPSRLTSITPPHYLRGLSINLRFFHDLPVAQRVTVKVVRLIEPTPVRPGDIASEPDTPGHPDRYKNSEGEDVFERIPPEAYNEYNHAGKTPDEAVQTPTPWTDTSPGADGLVNEANVYASRTLLNRQSHTNGARWETIWTTSHVFPGCHPNHQDQERTWKCKKTLKMNYKKSRNRVFTDSTHTSQLGTGSTHGFELDDAVRYFNNVHVVVTAKVLHTEYTTKVSVPTKQVRVQVPGAPNFGAASTHMTPEKKYYVPVNSTPGAYNTYNNPNALVRVATTATLKYPNDFMIKGMSPDKITDIGLPEGKQVMASQAFTTQNMADTDGGPEYTDVAATNRTASQAVKPVNPENYDISGFPAADPTAINLSPIGLTVPEVRELQTYFSGLWDATQWTRTGQVQQPYSNSTAVSNELSNGAQYDHSMYRGACVQFEGTVQVYHGVQESSPLHGIVTNNLHLQNRIQKLEQYISGMAAQEHGHYMSSHGHGNDEDPHWHTDGNLDANHEDQPHPDDTEDHHHDSPIPFEEEAPDNEGGDNYTHTHTSETVPYSHTYGTTIAHEHTADGGGNGDHTHTD